MEGDEDVGCFYVYFIVFNRIVECLGVLILINWMFDFDELFIGEEFG